MVHSRTGQLDSAPAKRTLEHVAPLLPATAPAPEPARRINFLKALLLYWLMPRRYGPHLAVASFRRAIAAHVVATILAGAILLAAYPAASWCEHLLDGRPSPFRGAFSWRFAVMSLFHLRQQVAETIARAAIDSAVGRLDAAEIAATLAVVPGVELAIVLLGVVLMPWCAGGDRAASVFKRSVKNAYWSTTVVIPFAVPTAGAIILDEIRSGSLNRVGDVAAIALISVLLAISFIRCLLVGAGRYVGEPDGPAFALREPRCDDCGYLIIGLPLDKRCPECGLPVRESLPGGRRQPTAWQEHEFRPDGLRELLRTQWRVLRGREFFRHLPVQNGLTAARHFWWTSFMLLVLLLLTLLRLGYTFAEDNSRAFLLAWFAALSSGVPFLLQTPTMFFACLLAQSRYGIRDYRVAATVCYYGFPLVWPLVGVLFAPSLLLMLPLEPEMIPDWSVNLSGLTIDVVVATVILYCVAVLLAVWFWWRRLLRALAAVRYANV